MTRLVQPGGKGWARYHDSTGLTCHSQPQGQAPVEEVYLRPCDEELPGQAQLGQADRVAQEQDGQALHRTEGDHAGQEHVGQNEILSSGLGLCSYSSSIFEL